MASKGSTPFIQPKLNIGTPGDKYEIEADKAADQILARSKENSASFFSPAPNIQKNTDEDFQKQDAEESEIQQKPVVDPITPGVQLKATIQQNEEEDLQRSVEEEVQQKSESYIQTKDELFESDSRNDIIQQSTEEEDLQEKEEEIQERDDEELQTLQMSGGDDNSSLETNLSHSKGSGSPLSGAVKSEMESGFGADFSGVRVHTDSNAVQMNQQLGSQAFTNGKDIYFNEGKYNPESDSGKHLLAHELTHTVQQTGNQGPIIQRAAEKRSDIEFFLDNGTRVYRETQNKQIEIPAISLPDFKERNRRRFPNVLALRRGSRQSGGHRNIWKESLREPVTRHVDNKLPTAEQKGGFEPNSRTYFFKASNGRSNFHLFGTREQIIELSLIPIWDKDGQDHSYDVDHVVEDQLVNSQDSSLSGLTDSNRASNFELLDSTANSSSGSRLLAEINRRLNQAVTQFTNDFPDERQLTFDGLRHGYNVNFLSHTFDLGGVSGEPNNYWDHRQLLQGEQLNKLEALTGRELRLLNRQDRPVLFTSAQGGNRTFVNQAELPLNNWLPRVNLTAVELADNPSQSDPAGWITVDAFKADEAGRNAISGSYENIRWRLKSIPGVYGASIDRGYFQQHFGQTAGRSLRLPGLSPIRIVRADITDRGIYVEGKVLPTVPFVANADIDLIIDGDSARIRKLFTSEEFSMPPPFSITNTTLEVSFGTAGLGINGQTNFGINGLGEGHIGAAASTSGGFELEGEFNFDNRLFDPAEINVEYKDNIWTIGGQIGIPEGKVRGVKSATITATYSQNNFSASGEAELDIPGIQRGNMQVNYGDQGFSIAGDFDLSPDIPGIRSGRVSARVARQNGAETYDIMVSGTAQPAIPGINSELSVTYENGALTIEGSAAYSRGMLSGNVRIGATNRAIGDDGQPSGEPDGTMRVYGGGSLTLRLTPWLEATAGVQFLPNGEIEITGRIGLPDAVDLFDRKSFDRNLFNMPAIEIPIFAIPLGPRSIGIVARITGGLDFSAGFGPGQLRNLSAEVTYNPDREEETTISGQGQFVIPADAGLKLRGDLGLGVSVGIASLTGGIEVTGELGLEGEALAQVDVNWSPQTGLAVDALGRITVNPKFTFDLNAFARASLDLWLTSISETWRYNLASFSWGPDIQFGVVFPVRYREGQPFDMSFDDIRVIYPQLNIGNMLTGLARDKKNEIF